MLRQRWVVSKQGIVETGGLFVGGNEAFEFFEPVENDSYVWTGSSCRWAIKKRPSAAMSKFFRTEE